MGRTLSDDPGVLAAALLESLEEDPTLSEDFDAVANRLAARMDGVFGEKLWRYFAERSDALPNRTEHTPPLIEVSAALASRLDHEPSADPDKRRILLQLSLATTLAAAMAQLPAGTIAGATVGGWTVVRTSYSWLIEESELDAPGEGEEDPTLAERFGPAPSAEELDQAHRQEHAAVERDMQVAMAGALTRTDAARRLGITPQAVSERKKAGALVAVRRGREFFFPAWQFAGDGTVPGLADVIDAWPDDALSLSVWAVTASTELGDQTPAQALAKRRVAAVLDLIQAIKVAGW
jgi:hypothetical protein